MKALTTGEKFDLIRKHGERISQTMIGAFSARRSDVLESTQRITELVKSIPKQEFGE